MLLLWRRGNWGYIQRRGLWRLESTHASSGRKEEIRAWGANLPPSPRPQIKLPIFVLLYLIVICGLGTICIEQWLLNNHLVFSTCFTCEPFKFYTENAESFDWNFHLDSHLFLLLQNSLQTGCTYCQLQTPTHDFHRRNDSMHQRKI